MTTTSEQLWIQDLDYVQDMDGFSLVKQDDNMYYKLSVPEYEEFTLFIDEVLSSMIEEHQFSDFCALYHRCISLTDKPGLELVFRRPMLRDAMTLPYKPLFLLAAKARTEIKFVASNHAKEVRDLATCRQSLPDALNVFEVDHREASFEEAVWIMDPKKRIILRNTKPVFQSVLKDKKLKFKISKVSDPIHNYINLNDGKQYTLMQDMHDIYIDREGLATLSFSETLKSYSVGEDKDDSNENELDVQRYTSTCADDENKSEELPKVLTTKSGKKLILRKTEKIISYQTPEAGSVEHVYMNVVLYHPHSKLEEIHQSDDNLRGIFYRKDKNPMRNGAGRELTKLETVRTKVFPKFNPELWKELFENL